MSKLDQAHFLDKLRRTVQPSPQRTEPLVWFREVRILTELSQKEGVERRRIVLHRGLNILWAAPEDPDTEQGLYRDGLAGHASGKTLFCRLLRHLLGEFPFGTKAQRDGIASNFAKLWAVASVRVNSVSWVVGRPLASAGSDFAIQAETIEEVLAGEPPTNGFDEYKKAVAAITSKADELHPGEGWRHLLPWLSRDQEARFSSLAQWRESGLSEGDSPQTKAVERHLLMRAILGLLDLKEPKLRVAIERAQANLEAGITRLGRLESELKGKLGLAHEGAREVLGKDAPTEVDALQSRLESILDIGCGTGAESLSLLDKFSFITVVGVDLAGPMLDQLRGKMEKLHIRSDRFVPVRADFLTDACLPSELRQHLPKEAGKRGFDAVISAFTLHHFSARQKSFAYRRVCECLTRDGVFLNGDLFNYEGESSEMSTAALKFEVDWIRRHFLEEAQRIPESGPQMMKLSKKWVAHYKYDNSCHSVTTQLKMLRAAGFRQAANPFRYWQVGLLWGLR